jgi:O-antigen ligase
MLMGHLLFIPYITQILFKISVAEPHNFYEVLARAGVPGKFIYLFIFLCCFGAPASYTLLYNK